MVVLFFRMESSKWKVVFHFFKPILDTSFRLSQLFFGEWNWFLKGLVYLLSHDCHFNIDYGVLAALCRSSSGDSVGLLSQTICTSVVVTDTDSQTSLMVGGFRSKEFLVLLEEETDPSVVRCGNSGTNSPSQ